MVSLVVARWPTGAAFLMLEMGLLTLGCLTGCQVGRLNQLMTDSERLLLLGSFDNDSHYEVVPQPALWRKRRHQRELRKEEEEDQVILDFYAMGRPFKLQLFRNKNLLASSDAILRIHNMTKSLGATTPQDCYYHGYSIDQPNTVAAMSLCDGLRGMIQTSEETYIVRPVPEGLARRSGLPNSNKQRHIMIVKRDTPADYVCPHALRKKNLWRTGLYPYSRYRVKKRATSSRKLSTVVIETAVFLDQALFDVMRRTFPTDTERELTTFVLTMMNAVQLLFQHTSLGRSPTIQLVLMEILKYQPQELIPSDNIDTYLTNFCIWQHSRRHYGRVVGPRWDHALLLSGINMYVVDESGRRKRHVVGLAPVSGMCNPLNSCTISEGTSFQTVLVAAHEMGHSLGMEHDGPQDGNHCDVDNYIMSPTLGAGKTTWSSCSRQYLEKFLGSQQASCLHPSSAGTQTTDLLHPPPDRLPGQMYDADYQCALRHGDGSRRSRHQSPEEMCRMLRCDTGYGGKGVSFAAHPALEGTMCDREKWCRGGRCVAIQNPKALVRGQAQNGGWGAWSSYSQCTSECVSRGISPAVGVMLSTRRCDNPRPQNGGRFCQGRDRRIKTCDATAICSTSPRRIALEDFISDTCRKAAAQDSTLEPSGTQFPSQENSHSCYVWCHKRGGGYMTQGWTVPDGTPCWRGYQYQQNQYCVKGECQAFDCNGNSVDQPSPGRCTGGSPSAPINEVAWGPWHQVSECRASCVFGGMGFQLVSRECNSVNGCSGMRESFRLCEGSKSTCRSITTAEQYASEVCRRYRIKYPTVLSGNGRQLPSRPGNAHSPCIVACQDRVWKDTHYQMDVYEDGKFPFGTSCNGGDSRIRAYCLNGRCVEFDADGIPKSKDAGHTFDARRVLSRIKRRDIPNYGSIANAIHDDYSPLLIAKRPDKDFVEKMAKHKKYHQNARWAVEMTECSSPCGGGTKNITVVCVTGDMIIDDWFCYGSSKPGDEGIWPCNVHPCTGRWQVSEWGSCSVSCGKGIKRRSVMCLQQLSTNIFSLVNPRMCTGKKPKHSEPCEISC